MKITKSRLKEIILEELAALDEQEPTAKLSGTDARKAALDSAKGVTTAGIDDVERSVMATMVNKLQKAAAMGRLTSSNVQNKLKLLDAELDKIIGETE
tara:strand:- start:6 stop:299 length:294 start_codon:yes stop_codon:yes gene_type:complete